MTYDFILYMSLGIDDNIGSLQNLPSSVKMFCNNTVYSLSIKSLPFLKLTLHSGVTTIQSPIPIAFSLNQLGFEDWKSESNRTCHTFQEGNQDLLANCEAINRNEIPFVHGANFYASAIYLQA